MTGIYLDQDQADDLCELLGHIHTVAWWLLWTPTGFVDTIRSGTMVYEERTRSGTGSQEVHPGI